MNDKVDLFEAIKESEYLFREKENGLFEANAIMFGKHYAYSPSFFYEGVFKSRRRNCKNNASVCCWFGD